jgi:hypothetical protein
MSEPQQTILQTLNAGGARATVLASVVCRLVIEGAELGALEEIPAIGIDGQPRTIKVLPLEWLERLARAIELGVFDRPNQGTMRKVVDRILAPPLPAHVESETV